MAYIYEEQIRWWWCEEETKKDMYALRLCIVYLSFVLAWTMAASLIDWGSSTASPNEANKDGIVSPLFLLSLTLRTLFVWFYGLFPFPTLFSLLEEEERGESKCPTSLLVSVCKWVSERFWWMWWVFFCSMEQINPSLFFLPLNCQCLWSNNLVGQYERWKTITLTSDSRVISNSIHRFSCDGWRWRLSRFKKKGKNEAHTLFYFSS